MPLMWDRNIVSLSSFSSSLGVSGCWWSLVICMSVAQFAGMPLWILTFLHLCFVDELSNCDLYENAFSGKLGWTVIRCCMKVSVCLEPPVYGTWRCV